MSPAAVPSSLGILLWVLTVLVSLVILLVGVIGSTILLTQREHGRTLAQHGEQLAVLVADRAERSNVAHLVPGAARRRPR